jgi:type II secretory pathway component PulM
MNADMLQQLMRGALIMGCAVAAMFFARFWRESRDRLFLAFSAAFSLLAVHWAALAIVNPPAETRHQLFILRLVAFAFLIAGIVDKNRRSSRE